MEKLKKFFKNYLKDWLHGALVLVILAFLGYFFGLGGRMTGKERCVAEEFEAKLRSNPNYKVFSSKEEMERYKKEIKEKAEKEREKEEKALEEREGGVKIDYSLLPSPEPILLSNLKDKKVIKRLIGKLKVYARKGDTDAQIIFETCDIDY